MKTTETHRESPALPELFDVAENFGRHLTFAKRLRGESTENWSRSLQQTVQQAVQQSPTRTIVLSGLLTGLLAGLLIAAGMTGIRVYRTRREQRHLIERAA